MDGRQRSARFAFWRRTILSLSVFTILYMGVVRPLQVSFVRNVIGPAIVEYSEKYDNVSVRISQDEIFLLPSDFADVPFDLPFGGFFLLPLTLFIASRRYRLIGPMCLYHGFLVLLFPVLGFFVFKGSSAIAIFTIIHEKVYKAIFIILGVLALRETSSSFRNQTN